MHSTRTNFSSTTSEMTIFLFYLSLPSLLLVVLLYDCSINRCPALCTYSNLIVLLAVRELPPLVAAGQTAVQLENVLTSCRARPSDHVRENTPPMTTHVRTQLFVGAVYNDLRSAGRSPYKYLFIRQYQVSRMQCALQKNVCCWWSRLKLFKGRLNTYCLYVPGMGYQV